MKMMGIIFSNIYDEHLGEITKERTSASLPFGGRYRLIDFVLSNMVNSGITNVGVITKSNYQSLMDHLGNGKEWDLDRKIDGLFILPPFGTGQKTIYRDKLEALLGTMKYINRSDEEYVLLSDSNIICNIDYKDVLDYHTEKEADITIITSKEEIKDRTDFKPLCVKTDSDGRIVDVLVNFDIPGFVTSGIGMYILKRELLISLLREAASYNLQDFDRDIIQSKYKHMKIMSYNFGGTIFRIDKITKYFEANMALLDRDVRRELFSKYGNIYTKVRDEAPTSYKRGSLVLNSFIADGCDISGSVENCVLFRGVTVGKGAKIKNSILMQDTHIGEGVELDYVICDKEVTVQDGRTMMGAQRHQLIVTKGKTV